MQKLISVDGALEGDAFNCSECNQLFGKADSRIILEGDEWGRVALCDVCSDEFLALSSAEQQEKFEEYLEDN